MAGETMMFKLSGAAQAAQVPMLAGKSFTVGSTVATGDGLANWLFLNPVSGNGANSGMVALKLEGARQAGQLSTLVGQTVTVGKSPIGATAAGKWLVLHPGMTGTASKAGLAAGVAMQPMNFEVEGAAAKGAAGKAGVICKGAGTGKGAAALAGKGATVGKGAAACKVGTTAAVGNEAIAVTTAGSTLGAGSIATGTTNAMAGGSTLTGSATLSGGAKAAASAATAASTKGAAAAGTIWTGSGTSLGLGLGLGAWGPILLVGALAAVGVGIYSYMKRPEEEGDLEDALS
ncbi:Magnetosome protein MamD-like [Candidatus Magnetaquicoccaceae bacterium FCR-1]|uniref:Magnetosome protein MamD-like n=1 Tax=Candidatus Magnetaquiglobus chichijimensis TaxID=3141448 RepID=A0ABQ0CAG7_9PROT